MMPLIVALDYADRESALAMAACLDPGQCRLKVGKELFTRCGPGIVQELQDQGFQVFLDLKFHDIPATVAGACRAAADLGVWMLNIHAAGGREMMLRARDALGNYQTPPLLIAVTVLTSLQETDLRETGVDDIPGSQVLRLARLAADCAMDGVVASAQEAMLLRREVPALLRVTPGIRPLGTAQGDQQRILSPSLALARGADYLVVGRPITAAQDPAQALAAITAEITQAMAKQLPAQ